MTESAKIVVREIVIEDKGFILSTWLRGNYYGSDYFRQMDKETYFKEYVQVISHLLYNPLTKILVASLDGDPNTVFGYVVYQGPVLIWAFTKKDYRGRGIFNMLISNAGITTAANITKAGAAIIKKKGYAFNPLWSYSNGQ